MYIYTMDYYSAIKEWNNAICGNLDKPRDDLTKWIKSDKEIAYALAYMQNKKKKITDTNELTFKTETDSVEN